MANLLITSRVVCLDRSNVDTDLIIPAHFIKGLTREGLARGAFAALRADGRSPFDDAAAKGARILIAGANFGCGSSREHAVWALQQLGLRAVLAPSFGSIFEANALRNGLLAIRLAADRIGRLMSIAADAELTIKVAEGVVIIPGEEPAPFVLDPFSRYCLLQGVDGVGLGVSMNAEIGKYEGSAALARPWEQQLAWETER